MSEIEKQSQKPKTCILAVGALAFAILSVLSEVVWALMWQGPLKGLGNEKVMGMFLLLSFGLAVAGLIKIRVKKSELRGKRIAMAAIVIVLLGGIFLPAVHNKVELRARMTCGENLFNLGRTMRSYASAFDGKYPAADKLPWCAILLKYSKGELTEKSFKCTLNKKKRSSYAMNPNCEPNSSGDMVLLFESKGGWNQYGGQELLASENHEGRGYFILFNDGHVEFVTTNEVGKLKWGEEKSLTGGANGVRRPGSDEELRYWLENVVWYHGFSDAEIRAATGLTYGEIETGRKRFNIRIDNRPERGEDDLLLVLPYPGGRHPRIGFLEGAINPQRETKFSVFTPWDANSYVVVDLPEAIWSNLGLTYLAHTHIDTIWSKQGIVLQKLEWNRRPDGTLDIERELPNEIAFGVKVRPTKDAVLMELWMKNGTQQRMSDLRVQICVMTKMAAGFEEQTNDNKVFTNPYVACRSKDGKKWIITAWENCDRPWGNEQCPCFHSDPKFADLEPGATGRLRGWLSFYEGPDVEAEFKRIDASGWRK